MGREAGAFDGCKTIEASVWCVLSAGSGKYAAQSDDRVTNALSVRPDLHAALWGLIADLVVLTLSLSAHQGAF